MNIAETQEMKARIDSVIEAASKYGKQAEMLTATRASLTDYIKQAEENNRELLAVAKMAKQVMDDTDKLVNGQLFEDLRPEIDRTISLLSDCKNHVAETTAQYEAAIKRLEESKDVLANQHLKAEELLAQTSGEVQHSIDQLKKDMELFEARFAALTESVATTVTSAFERIEAVISALPKEMTILADSVKTQTDNQVQTNATLSASINAISASIGELSPLPEEVKRLITSISSQAQELHKNINSASANVMSSTSTKVDEISNQISAFETDTANRLALIQEKISSIQSSIDQNRPLILENIQAVQTENQAIRSELSILRTELTSAKAEIESKVDKLVSQVETSGKQQKLLTIGCTAVIIVALIALFFLK